MTWKIPATPKSARALKREMAKGTSILTMEGILAKQMAEHRSPFAPVRQSQSETEMIIYDEEPKPLTVEQYAQLAVIAGRYTRKQVEAKIAELEAANRADGNTGIWVDARKAYIEDLKGKLNEHP